METPLLIAAFVVIVALGLAVLLLLHKIKERLDKLAKVATEHNNNSVRGLEAVVRNTRNAIPLNRL